MPLNAGDSGYGAVPGGGLSASMGVSESAALLIPEAEAESAEQWQPMTREELEVAAGSPGWRRARCYLVLLFWLAWLAMLGTAVAIVTTSPRPVVTPLRWWQKTLFYQLQPDLTQQADDDNSNALRKQLPYLKSLGIGALILEGLTDKELSIANISDTGRNFNTLTQIQQLLKDSNDVGLRIVLDFCELAISRISSKQSDFSSDVHHTLHFWLEQGVAGIAICSTDAAYSEKTLLKWREIFQSFYIQGNERILVVKQKGNTMSVLTNVTLVDVIMRPILPFTPHLLSPSEVADAIETHLQMQEENIWPSWTVGGKASNDLKKLLLLLTMTLPGTPAVQNDEDLDQSANTSAGGWSLQKEMNTPSFFRSSMVTGHSDVALFTSLSHSRAREEALLFGNFKFLPFNSSTNSTLLSPTPPPSPPVLAFLRSWGCVHFLVLLNVGPTHHTLNPDWAPSLPSEGVFVTSSGMDRLGTMTLRTLEMKPHEAILIKLFEPGSYS